MADAAAAAAAAAAGAGARGGSGSAVRELNFPLLDVANSSNGERSMRFFSLSGTLIALQQGRAHIWLQHALRSTAYLRFWTKVMDACVLSLLVVGVALSSYMVVDYQSMSTCKLLPIPHWMEVILLLLPFTIIPPAIYCSALVREAVRATPVWASLGVIQIACGITLTAWMAVCISGARVGPILTACGSLLILTLVLCGCSFNISKLRNWCCSQAEGDDDDSAIQ